MLHSVISQHADDAREAQEPDASRIALTWTGEPGRLEELTHGMLLDQAKRAAAALARLGVRAGDRVAVHLPLVPESVIATLACGRLDAIRTTLPVSLTVPELVARTRESDARVLITADAAFWDGAVRPVKPLLDHALARGTAAGGAPRRTVLVVNRCSRPVSWKPGRDLWWHEVLEGTAVNG
ncbi:AMP-binding protein [Streptomyces lydicus]|uniref:AMP-binding protein n=1 Tax=Streptomyces lydicus TaxID=47763 RepID=UPI00098129B6|nr:AMP-binding protein [Streptomyces lydicus]MDC7338539.1 AMP-binding protein [Streptomyces lydicus]UEG92012.1 AMP-binding protein [Streptomyces lydicus]